MSLMPDGWSVDVDGQNVVMTFLREMIPAAVC
jgi:hypothetical protein